MQKLNIKCVFIYRQPRNRWRPIRGKRHTSLAERSAPTCPLVEEVYQHTYENDLRYALRSSGSSFGIVTDFLYKIYPRPETLSCVMYVYLENEYDFMKLDKAAKDGRYHLSWFAIYIFNDVTLSADVGVWLKRSIN